MKIIDVYKNQFEQFYKNVCVFPRELIHEAVTEELMQLNYVMEEPWEVYCITPLGRCVFERKYLTK